MALPEIVIGSKLDAKGFKQAESATDKLGRSVKNLAKTLGLAFSAAAIINFGKAAVRASLEAQAQQQRLSALLKVTNGATQDQVNVLNDQAAALEKIGVVTGGNVTQVQSQLATFDLQIATIKALTPAILDYVTAEKGATASASDFKSMTNGLAQALNGNFTSLTRTGFVLDDVTKDLIKNGTEAERAEALVKVLNSTYKDFNKNLRDTPAGQFQVLANSAEQAKTIIGTDLLAALQLVSGPEGIGGAADAMEEFATQIGNVIYGMGILTKKVKDFVDFEGLNLINLIPVIGGYFGSGGVFEKVAQSAANEKARLAGTPAQSPGQRMAIDKANRDALKLQKSKNTLSKIDNDNTARKLTLTGDQLALLELEKKFDVERIGLYAALNQSTEGETRMRLLSLIAIHDQNAALAGMIKKANEAEDAFAAFTEGLRSVIRGMLDSVGGAIEALQKRIGMQPSAGGGFGSSGIPEGFSVFDGGPNGYQGFGSGMSDLGLGNYGGIAGAGIYGGGGAAVVNYNINASGIGDQQIASVVQNAIQDLNRYGSSTTFAGAL
jgi:hypothetical protein